MLGRGAAGATEGEQDAAEYNEDLLVRERVWPWMFATIAALAGVALALAQYRIRPLEAWFSAMVLDAANVADARSLGTAVVFPLDDAFVGFTVAAGCTAALLVSPFGLLAGGLIAFRRTTIKRGLATLGMVAAILFAVNQARFLVIALSMRVWGFELGYDISHVLLGTVVSTLGVLAGLLLYVRTVFQSRLVTDVRG